MNNKQLTINERHGLGSHEEQLLLFLKGIKLRKIIWLED